MIIELGINLFFYQAIFIDKNQVFFNILKQDTKEE